MDATTLPAPSPDRQVLSLSAHDVGDRVAGIDATYRRPTINGICIADGFGVRISVDRGALVVADGIGEHRRVRRFDKATHGLSRLVVLRSSEGFVTLEALRWCDRLAIAVLVVGPDGTVSLSSIPRSTDDARLLRAQARRPE